MNSQKISIIVPIYNVGKYLRKCIDSIIGQSYQNLEIILVDDGSTDDSFEICDDYAKIDNRIKVIHKLNGGQSDARNVGMEIATGELLFFVDADDYINKYALEILSKEMENSGADIIECHSYNFIDGEDPIWNNRCKVRKRKEIMPIEWLTETNLGEFISCAVWNKLYRMDVYRGIRFPIGRVFEDEATTYKVIDRAKKICRIDCRLYFYRKRANSTITSDMSIKKCEDSILAFQERVEFFAIQGKSVEEKFSKAKLCLDAISLVKNTQGIDSRKKLKIKLFEIIKNNYLAIKGEKCIPIKFRIYIRLFLKMNNIELIKSGMDVE